MLLGFAVVSAVLGNPCALALAGSDSSLFAWTNGARGTISVAALVLFATLAIGTFAGGIAALGPRLADACLTSVMEIGGALPSIAAVVVLHAITPVPALLAVGLVLAVLQGLATAKAIRAQILQLLTSDFMMASRALGCGRTRLFFSHLLPHVASSALAGATSSAAAVMGLDAALSFLGLETTGPSFGAMLADSVNRGRVLVGLFPVATVAAVVFSLQVVAESIEDRFAPGRRFL